MKLFEHEAKNIFKSMNISVPKSVLIGKGDNIAKAIARTGLPCVIKAQVQSGGRGKAGLIRFSSETKDAVEKTGQLLIDTNYSAEILIEEAVDIERELYLSITVDPLSAEGTVIACAEGGIEIEILAEKAPDKIIREGFSLTRGLMGFQSKNIIYRLGLEGDTAKKAIKVLSGLYKIFKTYDAELVEINPLFISKEGDIIAGDGKIVIDDNSAFRQLEYKRPREFYNNDAAYEAALEGIPFLEFDGDISLMCAGAGLTTTVYDLINYEGGTTASYLEFGGPNYKKAVKAMELCLKTDSKVILIVTFGTIARADVMAEGIVEAINRLKPDRPIVTCIRGTNEKAAVEILKKAGLEPIFDTEEAVKKAVAIAGGRT